MVQIEDQVPNHSALAGKNRVVFDPPHFHFQPDHPSVEEGFCFYGRWAQTDEDIAVVEVTVVPSCFVEEADKSWRPREESELPDKNSIVGINTEAIRIIRLIDIREGIYRTLIDLKQRAEEDLPTIKSKSLTELLERVAAQSLEMPRRKGRPVNTGRKRQRAEDVIEAFELGVRGARQRLLRKWKKSVRTSDGVGSEIKRLLEAGWLLRSREKERGRYEAGPLLIAEHGRS